MAQIKIQINGRSYDVACDDGQEDHVLRLGRYVDKKVGDLSNQIGQVGDTRLLVMAALVIADELSEAYGELEDIREGKAGVAGPGTGPTDLRAAEDIRALVRRIESIARSLEGA